MTKILLIILLLLSTAALGCLTNVPEDEAVGSVNYIDIQAAEAKARLDSGEYFILDVRTQEEYDAGHLTGAVLIPHTELSGRLDEIPRDMPLLVHCKSGGRSVLASQILIDNGYPEVYNMAGGIIEWEKAGYPI